MGDFSLVLLFHWNTLQMTGLSITKSSAPDSHKTYSVDTKYGISDYNKQILSFYLYTTGLSAF